MQGGREKGGTIPCTFLYQLPPNEPLGCFPLQMALAPLAFVSVWVCCQFLSQALLHLQPCQIFLCQIFLAVPRRCSGAGAEAGELQPGMGTAPEALSLSLSLPGHPVPAEGEM